MRVLTLNLPAPWTSRNAAQSPQRQLTEINHGAQAGLVVLEPHFYLMKLRDGGDEGQVEPVEL